MQTLDMWIGIAAVVVMWLIVSALTRAWDNRPLNRDKWCEIAAKRLQGYWPDLDHFEAKEWMLYEADWLSDDELTYESAIEAADEFVTKSMESEDG